MKYVYAFCLTIPMAVVWVMYPAKWLNIHGPVNMIVGMIFYWVAAWIVNEISAAIEKIKARQ